MKEKYLLKIYKWSIIKRKEKRNMTIISRPFYLIDSEQYEKALDQKQSLSFLYLYEVSESRLECIDIRQG